MRYIKNKVVFDLPIDLKPQSSEEVVGFVHSLLRNGFQLSEWLQNFNPKDEDQEVEKYEAKQDLQDIVSDIAVALTGREIVFFDELSFNFTKDDI
jgi:hypothetical protein